MLFPVFAQAREKARAAACLSNLKQIGLAYTQYEQDYDETVPCGDHTWGSGTGWAGQIYPYVKSTATFLCPDDTSPIDVISYASNSNMVGYSSNVPTGPYPAPICISQMTSPSKTVMLFEVINCNGFTIPRDGDGRSPSGNGDDWFSQSTLYGSNGTTAASGGETGTSMKYATGVLANSQADNTDNSPANISGTTSYFTRVAGHHQNGADYLMADCHAKWLMPTVVGAGLDTVEFGSTSVVP